MSKVDPKQLPKGKRDELLCEMLQIFGFLGLGEEGKMLLRGILKESEVVMLARRLQIARKLLTGCSFQKISLELGVGLETIRHVHEWLEDKFDDYRSFLLLLARRLGKEQHELCDAIDQDIFQALRHRYPMNYVLLQTLLSRSLGALQEHSS